VTFAGWYHGCMFERIEPPFFSTDTTKGVTARLEGGIGLAMRVL
jgi:hypothetical protein